MRLLNSIKSTNQQARVRSKLTERELGESSDTVFENDRSSSVSRLFRVLHHFTTVTLDTVEIFFSASKRKEQVLEVRQQEQSILERREREREGGRERRGWAYMNIATFTVL